MADNNGTNIPDSAKILQSLKSPDVTKAITELTQAVNGLKNYAQNFSQSNFRDMRRRETSDHFRNQYLGNNSTGDYERKMQKRLTEMFDDFADSLEDSLMEAVTGRKFKGALNKGLENIAKSIGVAPNDLSKVLGRAAGQRLAQTSAGRAISGRTQNYLRKSNINMRKSYFTGVEKDLRRQGLSDNEIKLEMAAVKRAFRSNKTMNAASVASGTSQSAANNTVGNVLGGFLGGGKSAGGLGNVASVTGKADLGQAALSGTLSAGLEGLASFGPQALAATLALKVVSVGLSVFNKQLEEVKQSLVKYGQTLLKTATRDSVSKKENQKLAQQRLVQDVETLIKEPFEILKDAAQAAYDVWDNNLRKITATQGYTKADVQDLFSVFAERLRSEGLSDVVSGTSIIDSLSSVLETGLSGVVAEEFAYQATLLNAAIPTQDFFSYASTYASVAANAIKSGQSEAKALEIANQSLEEFANNLLYASRELAGGYTTGLKDATDLYEKAVKISQAARGGDVTQISGVLTAVAGIVGATAPDLATALTDAVYQAAVGGNNSSLVALRSMAGVNASNTEFLKQLANNPQKVFADLFTNLANMYNSSSDAFMEKAEGYAELFGLSSDVFQRVDFNYLADAISQMNVESSELDQNMKMLASGQTTLTKEQLVNRQINEYLIDEGLAYVLDNAAARSVQEHMWEEQIARELMEAEYGVELKGAGKELLATISGAVSNIVTLLTPGGWFKAHKAVKQAKAEESALENSIEVMLELGKVGRGRSTDLHNLTTRDSALGLVTELVTQMGGLSGLGLPETDPLGRSYTYQYSSGPSWAQDYIDQKFAGQNAEDAFWNSMHRHNIQSKYKWNVVSKSTSALVGTVLNQALQQGGSAVAGITSGSSASSAAQSAITSSIEKMISDEYLKDYIGQGSYEDWVASASKFGISDFGAALQAAGYNESDIRQMFKDKETEKGAEEQNAIREHEKLFRETGIAYWQKDFWDKYQTPEFEKLDLVNETLTNIYTMLETWTGDIWNKYAAGWSDWRSQDDDGWQYHVTELGKWANWRGEDVEHGWIYHTSQLGKVGDWLDEDALGGWLHHANLLEKLTKTLSEGGAGGLVKVIEKGVVAGLESRLQSAYDAAFGVEDFDIVAKVQADSQKENSNALQALTDVLTEQLEAQGAAGDPAIQTNMILAEILKQLQSLNAATSGMGISNTLQGLATGR